MNRSKLTSCCSSFRRFAPPPDSQSAAPFVHLLRKLLHKIHVTLPAAEQGVNSTMRLIKYLHEALTAKKYTYSDKDIGDLRRVGGCWRVESPRKTLGVSVKILGSDRFGPNRRALESYKNYKGKFSLAWKDAAATIKKKIEQDKPNWYNPEAEYDPLEIIFGDPKGNDCDMSIAFSISTVDNNEFFANFNEGQFTEFGSMYYDHDS